MIRVENLMRCRHAETLTSDALRAAGVRELPLVVADDGDRWTGLRVDKIVELRRGRGDR